MRVPASVFIVELVLPKILESPKSPIFGLKSSAIIIFDGLISLWTICCLWSSNKPNNILVKIVKIFFLLSPPLNFFLKMKSYKSPFS